MHHTSLIGINNINHNRSATPPPVKINANLPSPFESKRILNWRAHEKGVKDLALMDNDKLISCAGDNMIRIWDKY